jgi:hypothetical protein
MKMNKTYHDITKTKHADILGTAVCLSIFAVRMCSTVLGVHAFIWTAEQGNQYNYCQSALFALYRKVVVV